MTFTNEGNKTHYDNMINFEKMVSGRKFFCMSLINVTITFIVRLFIIIIFVLKKMLKDLFSQFPDTKYNGRSYKNNRFFLATPLDGEEC